MTVDTLICQKCKHKLGLDSERWCLAFEHLPYNFDASEKHNAILPEQSGGYVFEPIED